LYTESRYLGSSMLIAVRSVVAYLLIVAYIVVAGPVALLLGGLFRWEGGLFALGHFGVWLALTTPRHTMPLVKPSVPGTGLTSEATNWSYGRLLARAA